MNNRQRILVSIVLAIFVFQIVLSSSPNIYHKHYSESSFPELLLGNGTENTLLRTILIKQDSNSLVDEFSYIASVPLAVYTTSSGNMYKSPVVMIENSSTIEYFLQDWGEYLSEFSNSCESIGVGLFGTNTRNLIQDNLHQEIFPLFEQESPFQVASDLALYDWKNASTVFVAPINISQETVSVSSNDFNLSFEGVSQSSGLVSGSVSNGVWSNSSLDLGTSDGYIIGNLSWSPMGSRYITHAISSPSGIISDYSTNIYAQYQANQYSLPIFSEFLNTESGNWTLGVYGVNTGSSVSYDYDYQVFPAERTNISVPANAASLNVSVSWSNLYNDVNLYLASPSGYIAGLSNIDNSEKNIIGETISILEPEEGNWEVIAVWMNPTTSVQVTGSYEIATQGDSLKKSFSAASNGAILASNSNSPLLYTLNNMIPEITYETLQKLNASEIVIVDPLNGIENSVVSDFSSSFSNVTYLGNYLDLNNYWNSILSSNSLVVCSVNSESSSYILGSTLAGAVSNSPIIFPNSSVYTRMTESWSVYSNPLPEEPRSLEGYEQNLNLDDRIPNRYTMQHVGNYLNTWFNNLGLNTSNLETIRVFSPLTVLPTTVDRILLGQYSVGRLSGNTKAENIVITARGLFYRELISVNQEKDTAHLSLYAYAEGTTFRDNNGVTHNVDERALIESALNGASYNISWHIGMNEMVSQANQGSTLWSISTHGVIFDTHPTRFVTEDWLGLLFSNYEHEIGVEVGGSKLDPDFNNDGIVDPDNSSEEEYLVPSWFDSRLTNLKSPIITVVGCLLGSSEYPELFLSHGATNVISSTRSVYFHSGGWSNVRFVELLSQDFTSGQVIQTVINETSEAYSSGYSTVNSDWSLQFVLFGDPDVTMYKPGDITPIPIDPTITSKDGHAPGYYRDKVIILGDSNRSSDDLDKIGISYSYFDIDHNLSDYLEELSFYPASIIESGLNESQFINLSQNQTELLKYIENGGVVALLGFGDSFTSLTNISGLPINLEYNPAGTGFVINLKAIEHSLLNTPNLINSSKISKGTISSSDPRMSVISERSSSDIVWLAGVIGEGKITAMTLSPDQGNYTDILENIVNWVNIPKIRISDLFIQTNYIQGQSLDFGVYLVDNRNYPINDASINITISNIMTNVTSRGDGWYTVNLTSEFTENMVGTNSITISANKTGYDPLLTTVSIQINQGFIPLWLEPYIPYILLFIIGLIVYFSLRKSKKSKEPKIRKLPQMSNSSRISRPGKLKIPLPVEEPIKKPPKRTPIKINQNDTERKELLKERILEKKNTSIEQIREEKKPVKVIGKAELCPICGTPKKEQQQICLVCGFAF
ncbi:MAG: hypothetical protein ACTSUV_03945 [Candidatus Ranarchaeia archaeon]